MQTERWHEIERIFNEAVALPVGERRGFVFRACGHDFLTATEVLDLLDADAGDKVFFEEPVYPLGYRLLDAEFDNLLEKSAFASYQLHKKIGRGGMGAVFLAEDTRLERFVALKVLPPQLTDNSESVRRFQQEARAASAISHPNVAHVYESGLFENRYFMAMEYVPGVTLRELMQKQAIELPTAVNLALQIAKAICAAHKAGVIHRDIKPENVIVMEDGGENLVKVLDFGLAKFGAPLGVAVNGHVRTIISNKNALETSPGVIIGTTGYMSPEQVRGQTVEKQTDIWSFGVVLYELLAGKRPFDGATRSDVQAAILLAETPAPPPAAADLSELSGIIARALRKDAAERYQDASEIVSELQIVSDRLRFAANQPATAATGENSAGFLNPSLLLLIVLLFAFVVVGTIFMMISAR